MGDSNHYYYFYYYYYYCTTTTALLLLLLLLLVLLRLRLPLRYHCCSFQVGTTFGGAAVTLPLVLLPSCGICDDQLKLYRLSS